jgi:hypothetical protein
MSGGFEGSTKYGEISLKNVSGDLAVSTKYGDITGSVQVAENKLDLSTTWGDIIINKLKLDDKISVPVDTGAAKAQTPGSVEAKDLRYTFASPDEIKINTGAASGKGKSNSSPNMKLKSKHGSVVVR